MPKFIDATGQRYGRWTVVARSPKQHRYTYWSCVCDCGNLGDVSIQNLRSAQSTSCGCRTKESTRARSTTHGATTGRKELPEYKAWKQMKVRCLNVNNPDFSYYGGRGITVSDAWLNDFAAFIRDMGPRPKGHTLDRIDTDGPYAAGNCRWATRMTQSNNTRQCIYTVHQGERITLAELARRTDVDYAALRIRVKRRKQTPEQAVFALKHGRKRRGR